MHFLKQLRQQEVKCPIQELSWEKFDGIVGGVAVCQTYLTNGSRDSDANLKSVNSDSRAFTLLFDEFAPS